MLSRRLVLCLVAVVAVVLSSASVAQACHGGGCFGGLFGGGLFGGHHCGCGMGDCGCGCGCADGCGCDDGCGCEGGDCGCGSEMKESTEEGSAAPAGEPSGGDAAPAAPDAST
jgi:hypothetical protein